MLAKKTRYSILALVKLAKEYGRGPLQISEIAKSEKIPQRFLEILLGDLKKMGFLGSKSGKEGGYFLIKNPKEVNLCNIIDYSEGSLSWVPCTSEKSYQPCEFCKDEEICALRKVYSEIRNSTKMILQKTSLHDLISN